uniref:Uncharacterized protein n=1 Tax=Glossina austeni TaxID=7395 RepID=A0A1A9VHK0_GLOAU
MGGWDRQTINGCGQIAKFLIKRRQTIFSMLGDRKVDSSELSLYFLYESFKNQSLQYHLYHRLKRDDN